MIELILGGAALGGVAFYLGFRAGTNWLAESITEELTKKFGKERVESMIEMDTDAEFVDIEKHNSNFLAYGKKFGFISQGKTLIGLIESMTERYPDQPFTILSLMHNDRRVEGDELVDLLETELKRFMDTAD